MTTTMMMGKEEIIKGIDAHIKKFGRNFNEWYVGIASNPYDSLFRDHNVKKFRDEWIFRSAPNSKAAREVEKHFIRNGTLGGSGGGDGNSRFVYAYKTKSHTRE